MHSFFKCFYVFFSFDVLASGPRAEDHFALPQVL